jgi:ABC-type transporter Mla MlaB component
LILGSAQLIILSITNNERRQMNSLLKENLVNEIVSRSNGRLSVNSSQLEDEVLRQLSEPTDLLHLVDYSSRDDYSPQLKQQQQQQRQQEKINTADLRRVSRIDVTTSLRLVQNYRTVIHRLCQLYRSHLRLTQSAEHQRHLILVARDEYYLFDLAATNSLNISNDMSHISQRQHDIFKREVNNVLQQPFDYVKYRRETQEQQNRLLEEHFQQRQKRSCSSKDRPPPSGHPSEAEYYLGK